MKHIKFYTPLFALALSVMLASCSADADLLKQSNETDNAESTNTAALMDSEPEATDVTIQESDIRALMKENLRCMNEIFVLGTLPHVGEPIQGEYIYQVNPSSFENYAAFEAYVRSVYSTKTADMYLKDYPTKGDPLYLNIDGKLCVNTIKGGAKGYYVDWSNYTVNINSCENGQCAFTLNAKVAYPAEKEIWEIYTVQGNAVYENGRWLLTSMLA